jgi:hypothetical protein
LSDGQRQRHDPASTTHRHHSAETTRLYISDKGNMGGNYPCQVRHSRGAGWRNLVRVSASTGGSSVFTVRDNLEITQTIHGK